MKSIIEYITEKFKINSKSVHNDDNEESINNEYRKLFDKCENPKNYNDCIELYNFNKGNKYIKLTVYSAGWVHQSVLRVEVIELKKIEYKNTIIKINYNILYSDDNKELGNKSISIKRKDIINYHDLLTYDMFPYASDSPKVIFVNPIYNDILLRELKTIGYIIRERFLYKDYHEDINEYGKKDYLDWQLAPEYDINFKKIEDILKS